MFDRPSENPSVSYHSRSMLKMFEQQKQPNWERKKHKIYNVSEIITVRIKNRIASSGVFSKAYQDKSFNIYIYMRSQIVLKFRQIYLEIQEIQTQAVYISASLNTK